MGSGHPQSHCPDEAELVAALGRAVSTCQVSCGAARGRSVVLGQAGPRPLHTHGHKAPRVVVVRVLGRPGGAERIWGGLNLLNGGWGETGRGSSRSPEGLA